MNEPTEDQQEAQVTADVVVLEEDNVKTGESCPSDTEFQGKAKMCEGCPGQALCEQLSNSQANKTEMEQLRVRMTAIRHKILVVSGKGGVGKSSTAAALALSLSERGNSVAMLDVDICGPSIPRLLNIEDKQIVNAPYGWLPIKSPNHNIGVISVGSMLAETTTPVIWRGPRKTNLIKRFLKDTYWGKLDYLIIDTPPGTSDEHISTISSIKKANPDGAVIVTTPQEVSLSTIRKEISFCRKMNLPILGIIENMSGFICPCCGENTDIFLTGAAEQLANENSIPFLGRVPLDPRVTECLDGGKCIFCQEKDSGAVKALNDIVTKLVNKL